MKEFTYKAEGVKGLQKVYAVCEIAAMMKIIYKGQKLVSRSIKEVKHAVLVEA